MEHGHGKCHESIPIHLEAQAIIDVSAQVCLLIMNVLFIINL